MISPRSARGSDNRQLDRIRHGPGDAQLVGGGNIAGDGVNDEATTVFQVRNQGTQMVGVWLNVNPKTNGNGEDAVSFYTDRDRSASLVGPDNVTCFDVVDSICVGITFWALPATGPSWSTPAPASGMRRYPAVV
jgi:hypothetical protein